MRIKYLLTTTVFLLVLAVIYIVNIRGSCSDFKSKLELQQKEINDLKLKLNLANEVNEKRKARIEQLINGYPSGIWRCDNNANWIIFKKEVKNPTLNEIIAKLNEVNKSYREPIIILLKRDKSNVYLSINDSEQLTERMGSAGANCYLGEVVYSVTSTDGINAVIFEFDEGSHAVPGKYSRTDFEP